MIYLQRNYVLSCLFDFNLTFNTINRIKFYILNSLQTIHKPITNLFCLFFNRSTERMFRLTGVLLNPSGGQGVTHYNNFFFEREKCNIIEKSYFLGLQVTQCKRKVLPLSQKDIGGLFITSDSFFVYPNKSQKIFVSESFGTRRLKSHQVSFIGETWSSKSSYFDFNYEGRNDLRVLLMTPLTHFVDLVSSTFYLG